MLKAWLPRKVRQAPTGRHNMAQGAALGLEFGHFESYAIFFLTDLRPMWYVSSLNAQP
jgi:hypothetical protein